MKDTLGIALKLHHFNISTHNLEETTKWYRETLDFTFDYACEMNDPPARGAFMTHDDFGEVRGLKHVALGVKDVEDAVRVIKGRGVEFVTDIFEVPDSQGKRFAFFKDNTGILIEVYQPNKQNNHCLKPPARYKDDHESTSRFGIRAFHQHQPRPTTSLG